MSVNRLLCAVVLYMVSAVVLASNNLKFPGQTEIIVLDGKAAKDGNESVKLSNGQHQVVFQYKSLLKDSAKGNSLSMYHSAIYVVTFVLAGNQNYQFKGMKFHDVKDADKFAKEPMRTLVLSNEENKPLSYQLAILKKPGMQFGRDIVDETREFNGSSHAAALPSLIQAISGTSPLPLTQDQNEESASMAENNLKYWFKKADEDVRKSFLKWVDSPHL
ncbi:MAG: DUF2057 domain-containing protein [Candidatus Endonucleobacter sp. (ex Gigantidas childressi)]|nr:DUF2057 domain-containing protein [Candidatus Endonucleobacter sp. (ex Gigantidas childressi)]